MFEISETPAGPDHSGLVHLMRSKTEALCGAELTGDVVAEDCPLDCPLCPLEHHDETLA